MQLSPEQQLPTCIRLLRQNRVDEAAEIASVMTKERPHDAQSRFASALVDRHKGKVQQALASLQRLTTELPQNHLIRLEFASTLVMTNQSDRAIPPLREILSEQPDLPLAHYWLGQAHLRSFRGAEAIESFERMRTLAPRNQLVNQPLAAAHLAAGQPVAAERLLREVLKLQPDNTDALASLAVALEHQNRLADAGPVFRRILDITPGHAQATAGLARLLQTEGKRDQARETLRPAFESPDPTPVVIATFAGLCESAEDRRACVAKVRAALDLSKYPAQGQASMCFAAARLLDADADYDNAYEFFARGNALSPTLYKPEERSALVDQLALTFSADAIRTMPRATASSDRPIFILGMPRSGTTLIEQILAAHPDVRAAGELQELRRIWQSLVKSRGNGTVAGLTNLTQIDVNAAADRYLAHLQALDAASPRVTDKMPHNFEQLGLINLLFPTARVIHCTRNPLDTCVSCFATQLGMTHTYANDLSLLGHAYAQYHRLMAHWRSSLDVSMLDIAYEDVVADTETLARRIVEFVGLPWHDACLRFYDAQRTITSASVDQVRMPIYATSVSRWKRYADHLGPLRNALHGGGVPLPDHDKPD